MTQTGIWPVTWTLNFERSYWKCYWYVLCVVNSYISSIASREEWEDQFRGYYWLQCIPPVQHEIYSDPQYYAIQYFKKVKERAHQILRLLLATVYCFFILCNMWLWIIICSRKESRIPLIKTQLGKMHEQGIEKASEELYIRRSCRRTVTSKRVTEWFTL